MKYTALISKKEVKIEGKKSYATETVGTLRGHCLQCVRGNGCLRVEERFTVVVIER